MKFYRTEILAEDVHLTRSKACEIAASVLLHSITIWEFPSNRPIQGSVTRAPYEA